MFYQHKISVVYSWPWFSIAAFVLLLNYKFVHLPSSLSIYTDIVVYTFNLCQRDSKSLLKNNYQYVFFSCKFP